MNNLNIESKLSFWTPPPWAVIAISLVLILSTSLSLPLVAGLSMFIAVRWVFNRIEKSNYINPNIKNYSVLISALICILFTIGLITAIIIGVNVILDDKNGLSALMIKMNEALLLLRNMLPNDMATSIPANFDAALIMVQDWIKSHSGSIPAIGKKVVTMLFHLIIGVFIGLMTSITILSKEKDGRLNGLVIENNDLIWLKSLKERIFRFVNCFENVFLAQINIALVNATFTGLFLAFIMPLLGYDIPFVKMLTLITFFLGLIPILGNLVSNTIIFLVSLSVAPIAAIISLSFLIIIHKLEYFLNALIIGSKIHVKSHELLSAMLIFEVFFGLWGLVLAPVLYAFIKGEIKIASTNKE